MARVSDGIRRQLLNLAAGNRRFMDGMVQLIWCECRAGNTTKSTSWEDWCDIELEWYGGGGGAEVDRDLPAPKRGYGSADDCFTCFNTPRRAMTSKQLDAVQEFIDTHTFRDYIQARMEIAADLLDACQVCGLVTHPLPWEYTPELSEGDHAVAWCNLTPQELEDRRRFDEKREGWNTPAETGTLF